MNNNDKKFKEYQKRKICRYLIIILSFLVIVLEALALFKVISYVWGLIPFFFSSIVKYIYNKPKNTKQ